MSRIDPENYQNHKKLRALYVICFFLNFILIDKLPPLIFSILSVVFLFMAYGQNMCVNDIEKIFEENGLKKNEFPEVDYGKIIIFGFILMMFVTWIGFSY
jgi:hypothetical protein